MQTIPAAHRILPEESADGSLILAGGNGKTDA
jgi:hypothetical protein